MEKTRKRVDGYRFLPPGLAAWVRTFIPKGDFKGPIPWTPMSRPLNEATVALVTSAGISLKSNPPFDMEREKREPLWGDRSYRAIPRGSTEKDIDVHHLHINTNHIKDSSRSRMARNIQKVPVPFAAGISDCRLRRPST